MKAIIIAVAVTVLMGLSSQTHAETCAADLVGKTIYVSGAIEREIHQTDPTLTPAELMIGRPLKLAAMYKRLAQVDLFTSCTADNGALKQARNLIKTHLTQLEDVHRLLAKIGEKALPLITVRPANDAEAQTKTKELTQLQIDIQKLGAIIDESLGDWARVVVPAVGLSVASSDQQGTLLMTATEGRELLTQAKRECVSIKCPYKGDRRYMQVAVENLEYFLGTAGWKFTQ